jgi:tRNA nucleotidyltransferase/poly(A) polymerase
MDEAGLAEVAGADSFLVGGVIRDELLGREIVDVDVATADPEVAARAWAERTGGALVQLSERHGAWRVGFRGGHTVDFAPLRGTIEDDLATRDFTVNAIARPLGSSEYVDPLGGLADLDARVLRAVTEDVFRDDPLRLLRAVRLAEELGFALTPETEALVRRDAALADKPAGERIFGELERLGEPGIRRLADLGLLESLGGSLERLDGAAPSATKGYALALALGDGLLRLPISNELRRFTRVLLTAERPEGDPRAIHRFRRATEPWAVEALGAIGAADLIPAVEEARRTDPAEPLLRGDELGLPEGPEIGRMLDRIAEERAAGTIATREEALDLVREEATWPG